MKGCVAAKCSYYSGHHLSSWGPHVTTAFCAIAIAFMLKGEELCKHVHQQTFLVILKETMLDKQHSFLYSHVIPSCDLVRLQT